DAGAPPRLHVRRLQGDAHRRQSLQVGDVARLRPVQPLHGDLPARVRARVRHRGRSAVDRPPRPAGCPAVAARAAHDHRGAPGAARRGPRGPSTSDASGVRSAAVRRHRV
ncbi:unnamed protein product, partial [Prorocentrum cordatum]